MDLDNIVQRLFDFLDSSDPEIQKKALEIILDRVGGLPHG